MYVGLYFVLCFSVCSAKRKLLIQTCKLGNSPFVFPRTCMGQWRRLATPLLNTNDCPSAPAAITNKTASWAVRREDAPHLQWCLPSARCSLTSVIKVLLYLYIISGWQFSAVTHSREVLPSSVISLLIPKTLKRPIHAFSLHTNVGFSI